MKSGIVCVYGQTNAGKSTLINKILGFKLLPISNKPQTTRDIVRAIYNDEEKQIVFVDTPGIFKPKKKFGTLLMKNAENAQYGVDLILYVVDLSSHINIEVTKKLLSYDAPKIILFNKIDLVKYEEASKKIKLVTDILKDTKYIEISCLNDVNIDVVKDNIKPYLKYDYLLYPTNMVSDRPKEYIISEIIREKCMRLLDKEVPHTIYVEIKKVDEDDTNMNVYGNIIVEKESEKAIIIGKNGKMIKEISRLSETSIHAYFNLNIYCDLRVKVIKNWRSNNKYLKQFGFYDES